MILFIIIAIIIFIFLLFYSGGLIQTIKGIEKHNKEVKEKRYYYRTSDLWTIKGTIGEFVGMNIILNIINLFFVIVISIIVTCFCKTVETQYSFKINSLKDNVVTSGKIGGGLFSVRGYVDGELSYFYSRTTDRGEKIYHLPSYKTYIKYDNEVDPYIEVHQESKDIPVWLNKLLWTEWVNSKETIYYTLVVPEGTISSDGTYEIDME